MIGEYLRNILRIDLSGKRMHLEALSAVTGWSMNVDDLVTCVERSVTLSRLFNIKNGLTSSDDWKIWLNLQG